MTQVAVIGAGLGAMAAAARLAVAGHQVAVYERTRTYGGGVRRFERGGFAFDTGPGLLHLPAVYRDLFLKTGKEPLEQCVELSPVDPASRHLFADGTDLSLPNASRAGVVAALDAALGMGTGERWSELLGRARKVWDTTRRPLLEEPLCPDPSPLYRDPYPARRRGLLRRGAPTLAEIARRELRDLRLAALLESHALAYGFDPRQVPASASILPYLEQTFGSWYVRGGIRALADALYEHCRARKVAFTFGTGVSEVLLKGGRVCGIELADGRRAEAEVVVAGALVPGLHREPIVLGGHQGGGPWGQQNPPTGRLVVCLALRGERPEGTVHRTVVHATNRDAEVEALFPPASGAPASVCDRPTVIVLRPDDPALVPDDGHEAVTLTVTVPPHGPVDWADPAVVHRVAGRVVSAAERAIPGLRERVLWTEAHTPADTARETGSVGGAVPGPALAGSGGAYLPADNRSPIPGLFFVGGFSHPGGGLAHEGMSGAVAAGLIVSGDHWRGSR